MIQVNDRSDSGTCLLRRTDWLSRCNGFCPHCRRSAAVWSESALGIAIGDEVVCDIKLNSALQSAKIRALGRSFSSCNVIRIRSAHPKLTTFA